MSYINRRNRRGRYGRSIGQRFNSLPPRRRIGISPYNPLLNRIRRGRIRATNPRSFNFIPRNRRWDQLQVGSNPRVGLSLNDSANSALNVGGLTFGGGLLFGPPGMIAGGALGGLLEYARHKWPHSRWWPKNWW